MLVAPIERDALLQVLQGPGEIAAPVERVAEDVVSDQAQRGVVGSLGQAEQLFTEPPRGLELSAQFVEFPEPPEDGKDSGLSPSCRHSSRADCSSVPLRVSRALCGHQRPARAPIRSASSCSTRSRLVGQVARTLQGLPEVGDGSRFAERSTARCPASLPLDDRLVGESGLRVVMRDAARAALAAVSGNRSIIVSAMRACSSCRRLKQRLVGGLLDECVLEDVGGVGRHAALVEQLGLAELRERVLQRALVEGRDGRAAARSENLRPSAAPSWATSLTAPADRGGPSASPAASTGMASGGSGAGRARSGRLVCEQPGLQHHLGELFDEQRHAVGLGHDLLQDFRGQRLPPVTRSTMSSVWLRVEPVERERGDVLRCRSTAAENSGREVMSSSDRRGRHLPERRGRAAPAWTDRPSADPRARSRSGACGERQEQRDDRPRASSAFCRCGVRLEGGAPVGTRQREERGQQRHALRAGPGRIAPGRPRACASSARARSLARSSQRALEEARSRVERAVLLVGRAAAVPARGAPLGRDLLREHRGPGATCRCPARR